MCRTDHFEGCRLEWARDCGVVVVRCFVLYEGADIVKR